MNNEASQASANPLACASMARHIAVIQRLLVDHGYAYDNDRLLERKLRYVAENCSTVPDVGQSSRDFFALFERQKIETMNINPHRFWKKSVEKRFGQKPARWLDQLGMCLLHRPSSELQVSGYYAWARK